MSVHEDWPEQPAWAEEVTITGSDGEGDSNPDEQIERQFLLEVTVNGSTARIEETHLRMEGEENAGLIDKVGPHITFSPEDLTPEMAADTLAALTELLRRYRKS